MKKAIDCLFIGHNEMDFPEYEKTIRKMGLDSGAYRDLSLNFFRYENRVYSTAGIYNVLRSSCHGANQSFQPLNLGETFSAAIAYLGTFLNRRGFTFDYINSFQDRKTQLAEKLTQLDILTIAVTTTYYISALPIIEIIDFILQYNTTAKIIIGGPFIATQIRNQDAVAIEYLFSATLRADFYVNSSQGEAALVEIIKALKNNLSFEHINNIYYKSNGRYISTPLRGETNVLSENMVDWDLFSHGVGEYANVRTSKSCPFSCAFCGFPQHAGAYQTADVEDVEEELKKLNRIKTLKSVHFIDDSFNVPPKRFKEILRMMIRNQFRFKWHSYFRCQFADRETVELMKESGCEGVFLGLESGNDQILKNMNKSATRENYQRGIEVLKEYGIVTFGNFIIGFPGETHETVQDTVAFIRKSGLDFYRTQLWYCEPITPIWKEREKYKIRGESFEWSHKTMDFKQACDLIEEIFLSSGQPIWVPQYNFDFDNLWHLVHRGMSIPQVGDFLNTFNEAVKEKFRNPKQGDVSSQCLYQLRKLCCGGNDEDELTDAHQLLIDRLDTDFDF
ncbi:MAG: PhpK family radical SAM P-methyltransferase [Candidatus Aminicenantes bacterium]|jgi:radical SAM PhpK family P-methyltransferase